MNVNRLRIIWLVISALIMVFALLRILDISVSMKYEVEELLMQSKDGFLLEKGEILTDQIRVYFGLMIYILLSSLVLLVMKTKKR